MRRAGADAVGLSKVSVQTGTSHGGVPLPGGGVAEVKLDFGTLERLSAVCRAYGLAGAVQHGASTLPDELFHHFPQVETAEIHLATGFQNAALRPPGVPRGAARGDRGLVLRERGRRAQGRRDRRRSSSTRPARRRWATYKRRLWELPDEGRRSSPTQEEKLRFLFEQLAITGTKSLVRRFVTAPRRSRPAPDSLREATPIA